MKLAILFLAIAVFVDGASCNSSGSNVNGRAKSQELTLAVGTWGGQHIHAEVTERGADIEFDCAQGSIAQKITLDGSGHFDVGGKFSTQHPGPTRDDESSSRTVQYRGTVKEDEMDLAIFDPKTKEDLGSFKLKLGNVGRLMKCR
jgi:hypothetical protein